MKKTCIALVCTLGIAACGGDERPAQSPTMITSAPGTTVTTPSTPQPATTATASPPMEPPPSPPLGSTDLTFPRSYALPETTDNVAPASSDGDTTTAIKKSVASDKALATATKNVKIVTTNGKVTLRGPVATEKDKSSIEAKAKATSGVTDVDNQIEVKKK